MALSDLHNVPDAALIVAEEINKANLRQVMLNMLHDRQEEQTVSHLHVIRSHT